MVSEGSVIWGVYAFLGFYILKVAFYINFGPKMTQNLASTSITWP